MDTALSIFNNLLMSSATVVVLGLLIIFIKWVFKNRLSPKFHYYIWLLLIVKLLIPYTPGSSFSIFNLVEPSIQRTLAAKDSLADNFDRINYEATSHEGLSREKASEDAPTADPEYKAKPLEEAPSQDINKKAIATPENQNSALGSVNIAFFIWLFGFLSLVLYITYTNITFKNLVKQCIRCEDKRLNAILEACKEKTGVKRDIPILMIQKTRTPSLYGIVKPKILMSADFTINLSENELKYVLLHELSHYKRKDIIISWLMVMLQAVHWFNPFVWYAFHLMRQDCEIACDAEVLSWINPEERKQYGQTIINLLRVFSQPSFMPITTCIVQSKHNLKRRIIMINMFRKKTILGSIVSVAIILMVGLVGLTGTKPSIYAQTAPTDPAKSKEQIHFADSNLAAAVAEAVDKPEGSPITKADVESIKYIYVDSPTNLEGIQQLTNLEELRFSYSSIIDYKPLAKLKNFKSIQFRESKTDIDLSHLKGLSKLETLHIDGCKVNNMDSLSHFSNLKHLSLARFKTPIDLTPLIGLSKFESLSVSEAKIADLNVISDLKNLKHLDLLFAVPDLKFAENLTKLESLYVDTNNIDSLSKLKNLKNLNISFMGGKGDISIIGTLKNLESLSIFGLEKNSDFKELQGLKKLKRLTIMDCSDLNNIDVLAALPNLEWLDIDGKNKLTDKSMAALANVKSLKRLDLRDASHIGNLEALESLDNLEVIIISSPEITNLDHIRNLKKLRHIVVHSGNINNIDGLSKLENVEYLSLRKNSISDISPISGLRKLKRVVLDNNKISDIKSLSELTELEGLGLDNNQISDLKPLSKLTKLESLSITGNNIIDISPLRKLTNIRHLYLKENKIKDFNPVSSYYKLLTDTDLELNLFQ